MQLATEISYNCFYMCTRYEVWPRKNDYGAKIIMVKNHRDATTFN